MTDESVQRRSHAHFIGRIGDVIFEHYHCEGPVQLLEAVIELYESHKAMTIISDSQHTSDAIARLGDAYFAAYRLNDDLQSLSWSINHYRNALIRPEIPALCRAWTQAKLSYALLFRFEENSSRADCEEVMKLVELAHQFVVTAHNDDAIHRSILAIVGLIKTRRTLRLMVDYKPTTEDIKAILHMLQSHKNTKAPRSQYFMPLIAEVNLNRELFEWTKSLEYLENGFRAARRAVQLYPEDAEVMSYHSNFAVYGMHDSAYQYYRGTEDWHFHVQSALDTVDYLRTTALPTRNTDIRRRLLHSWTLVYDERCDQLDDLDGLEQLMLSSKEVFASWPPRHITRGPIINNLVHTLGGYFIRTGRISALDEVGDILEIASDHLPQSLFLACNIAEAMLLRAQVADSQTARVLVNRALHACQCRQQAPGFDTAPSAEKIEINMIMITAASIQTQIGDVPFLDPEAIIELARQNLDGATSAGTPAITRMRLALAYTNALMSLAKSREDISYLLTGHQVLKETLEHHEIESSAYRFDLLAAQADIMVTESDILHTPATNAWAVYQEAVTGTSERARERFQVCLRWASHAATRGNDDLQAVKAYSQAIIILPSLVFRGEDIIGRIEALRQVSGLAASSAAIALSAGDYAAAVDFLEKTRGILWLQSFQGRTTELTELPDQLRHRFLSVLAELENADRLQWTTRRRKAAELDAVTSEIRALPGMDRFLLPPSVNEIEIALRDRDGYAIVVIPSALCCDVLVLGLRKGPSHLRLSALRLDRIQTLSQTFSSACSNARESLRYTGTARKVSKNDLVDPNIKTDATMDLLKEIWVSLVQPIVEHLKSQDALELDGQARKRVWWCPIGALGTLPIHAAGIYDGPSQDHVGNHVVSSYTPTLTTLHRLLVKCDSSHVPEAASANILLIGQPDVANQPSLPHAAIEVDLVRSLVPATAITNDSDFSEVSVSTALQQAANAHILHLACHGHQDQDNPLNSGFDLQDGRLTLGQLMHVKTPHAQLAYLSACESAGADESRPDEGLNLVGAMIFVGFKSVIGTLWAMDDLDGPFMAEHIYTRIFHKGILDMTAVPYALDEAVGKLRESGVPASRWATYVHFGL